MNTQLSKAINELGLSNIARACGVSYQAVRKWEKKGFPRTEWTGETCHSKAISQLSNGQILREELLGTKEVTKGEAL